MSLQKNMMLAALTIHGFGARKEDKAVTAEIAARHNVSTDAGKYNKVLVAKAYLEPINKAATALRQFHYENTVPMGDLGPRGLPCKNFEYYRTGAEKARDVHSAAVTQFCNIWESEIIPDARVRLNGMFRESDYPVDIGAHFGCRIKFLPVPESRADFSIPMTQAERETMRADIESELNALATAAQRELFERMAEPVRHMADKLAVFKPAVGNQKTEGMFRDSLVSNVRDVVALLARMNFADDATLEAFRVEIDSKLCGSTAQRLRDDMVERDKIARDAADIAARLSGFMA